MNLFRLSVLCIALGLGITACGGGGGRTSSFVPPQPADPVTPPPSTASPSIYALPQTLTGFSLTDEGIIALGGDVAPRSRLSPINEVNGITYAMGASRDGVGVGWLRQYQAEVGGLSPFRVPPRVIFDANLQRQARHWEATGDAFGAEALSLIQNAIDRLNDALPPEFHLIPDYYNEQQQTGQEGTILVRLASSAQITSACGRTAVACAGWQYVPVTTNTGYRTNAEILLSERRLRFAQAEVAWSDILHEFLHALGVNGHVNSDTFPSSLMGTHGAVFPNPGYALDQIDREALQIMYFSQSSTDYADWSYWSDTAFHLMGRSDDGNVNFGVSWFNGLPQPWVRGPYPSTLMVDVPPYLDGRVTWAGGLLGFSGLEPVAGEASLTVNLARIEDAHDLAFRDLYYINRGEEVGSGRWFPVRNLDYDVTLLDNFFLHASEEGVVTGHFLGEYHEGMAGTLKRTDLIGAFGGTR